MQISPFLGFCLLGTPRLYTSSLPAVLPSLSFLCTTQGFGFLRLCMLGRLVPSNILHKAALSSVPSPYQRLQLLLSADKTCLRRIFSLLFVYPFFAVSEINAEIPCSFAAVLFSFLILCQQNELQHLTRTSSTAMLLRAIPSYPQEGPLLDAALSYPA